MGTLNYLIEKDMAKIEFRISDKLADVVISKINQLNISVDEFMEESILKANDISLIDINGIEDIKLDDVNHNYYVYVYLNPIVTGKYEFGEFKFDYLPVYVGKGMGDRYKSHLNESHNERMKQFIQFLSDRRESPIILKLKENIPPNEAYRLESKLINKIGRLDLKTGPLFNLVGGVTYDDGDINNNPTLSIEHNKQLTVLKSLNNSKTIAEAALKLGISERTLYRKMKNSKIKKVNGNYIFV